MGYGGVWYRAGLGRELGWEGQGWARAALGESECQGESEARLHYTVRDVMYPLGPLAAMTANDAPGRN